MDELSRREKLLTRLKALPHQKRVAFAASCCERLMPNYAAFSRQVDWGSPQVLRSALDAAWRFVETGRVDKAELCTAIEACNQNIPDTEDFTHSLTSAALDAGAGVFETLQCVFDGSAQHSADVGEMAYDTVFMYFTDKDRPDPAITGQHPLVLAESDRQARTLILLESLPELSIEAIRNIRRENEGKSNLSYDAPHE
jgi:uncharacterized protein YjaG (DUF416 family)